MSGADELVEDASGRNSRSALARPRSAAATRRIKKGRSPSTSPRESRAPSPGANTKRWRRNFACHKRTNVLSLSRKVKVFSGRLRGSDSSENQARPPVKKFPRSSISASESFPSSSISFFGAHGAARQSSFLQADGQGASALSQHSPMRGRLKRSRDPASSSVHVSGSGLEFSNSAASSFALRKFSTGTHAMGFSRNP